MASFQIHRDNEKENPSMLNIKEKSNIGTKQPLAVIGGKEKALAPRANLGVLNTNNNHGNVPRGIPAPSGKVVRFHHNFIPTLLLCVVFAVRILMQQLPFLLLVVRAIDPRSGKNGGGFLSVCLSASVLLSTHTLSFSTVP